MTIILLFLSSLKKITMLKRFSIVLVLLLIFVSCSNTDSTNPEPIAEDPPPMLDPNRQWNLIWEDNFDNDLSLWNIWEGGAFNNEVQLYRAQQLSLADGILTITAQREAVTGPTNPFDSTPKSFPYVSGRLETKLTFGPSSAEVQTELRYMASIKFPAGFGIWPAFWSYGDPWPTQGEIDVIEARGNLPNEFSSNIFFGTEANMPITNLDDTVVEHEVPEDITADFHTYELIWTANSLEIKFDNRTLHKYSANSRNYIASLFGRKEQIVLNAAVGGVFFPNTNPSSYIDLSTMEIDWVRVYNR